MRQAIGVAVQFAVREPFSSEDQRGSLRRAIHACFEHLMEAEIDPVGSVSLIESVDNRRPLLAVHQVDIIDRAVRGRERFAHQPGQITADPFDLRVVEQCRRIFQAQTKGGFRLVTAQLQLERIDRSAERIERERSVFDRCTDEFESAFRTGRVVRAQHLFRSDVIGKLIRHGYRLANLIQRFRDGRGRGKSRHHRERPRKESACTLQFRTGAAVDDSDHRNVALPGKLPEQRAPARQQEIRGALSNKIRGKVPIVGRRLIPGWRNSAIFERQNRGGEGLEIQFPQIIERGGTVGILRRQAFKEPLRNIGVLERRIAARGRIEIESGNRRREFPKCCRVRAQRCCRDPKQVRIGVHAGNLEVDDGSCFEV